GPASMPRLLGDGAGQQGLGARQGRRGALLPTPYVARHAVCSKRARIAMTQAADPAHRQQLVRAVVASTIGTTIEWYDFFLYSTVTGLVFAKLFLPESDPLTAQLNAFGVYAVGFVARPIGAAIFGYYGDRIGRKATLISTL